MRISFGSLLAVPALLGALHLPTPAAAHDLPAPGIWTNMEDVYFAPQEGREQAPWTGLEIAADGRWRYIDAFRRPLSDWSDNAIPGLARGAGGGWVIGASALRRAAEFSCWFAVRKHEPGDDGEEDWTFQRALPIFDQGGRIHLAGGGVAPDVTFRLRNVTWEAGSSNNPVLVLYVHRDDPDRAESYSWASPDSDIVGLNLRWVQGGCNRVGSDAA